MTINEELDQEQEADAAELELFIQHQSEQEREDQHDLKLFYEIKQEEANIKTAIRCYKRLVKKYLNFLA